MPRTSNTFTIQDVAAYVFKSLNDKKASAVFIGSSFFTEIKFGTKGMNHEKLSETILAEKLWKIARVINDKYGEELQRSFGVDAVCVAKVDGWTSGFGKSRPYLLAVKEGFDFNSSTFHRSGCWIIDPSVTGRAPFSKERVLYPDSFKVEQILINHAKKNDDTYYSEQEVEDDENQSDDGFSVTNTETSSIAVSNKGRDDVSPVTEVEDSSASSVFSGGFSNNQMVQNNYISFLMGLRHDGASIPSAAVSEINVFQSLNPEEKQHCFTVHNEFMKMFCPIMYGNIDQNKVWSNC